jgi:hypothetical protein
VTTTPPAPTLTGHTDADPCPRVEVLITPMPGDAATVTVWRSWSGRREVVRGAKRALSAGDTLVIDYEAPTGVPVEYSCVTYDLAGTASEESPRATVTLDSDDVWLQDPLDPTSALQAGLTTRRDLMVIGPSFVGARPVDMTVQQPVGSALPFAFGRKRRAARGMPITVHAETQTAAAQLEALLDQAQPLCVRTPAAVTKLTGLTYVAVGEYLPDVWDGWQETTYPLVGDVVKGPGAAVVVNPRTFDDLPQEASTFDALLSLHATFIDLKRGA